MAIYLDFVGLNTLVYENVTSSLNLIGSSTTEETVIDVGANQPADASSKALKSDSTTDNQASLTGIPTSYPTTGGFSNSFWIKLDNTGKLEKTIWEALNAYLESSLVMKNGRMEFYAKNNAGSAHRLWTWQIDMDNFVNWQHVTLTWNGTFTDQPSLYIDTTLIPPEGVTGTATGTSRAALTKLSIFDTAAVSSLYELQGSLQEFAFYNKELTTTEISEIYNSGKYLDLSTSTVSGNILGYWELGEELTSIAIGSPVASSTAINATLGNPNLTANDNISVTSGFYGTRSKLSYENDEIAILPQGDSLVALNIHRNGPYGYSTFKQLRSSENPLTRLHNTSSIFSYVLDGKSPITNKDGISIPKNTSIRQIEESPIVTNNKPLTVIGGVSDYNRRTGKSTIERVEVLSSFNNEIQYFGDKQANREFNLELETHETYEDLTGLYLEGGIESEDSPLDQFELLRYQHTVYPKEANSYLSHVRGRPNFVSGYWRDLRTNRTQTGSIDNGFGFTVPSQSMWPLDVEDGWQNRTNEGTIGQMTMSAPCAWDWSPASPQGGIQFADWGDTFQVGTFVNNTPGAGHSYGYNDTTRTTTMVGEKYFINSREGVTDFWNTWLEMLEGRLINTTLNASTVTTRNNYNTITNPESTNKSYLEIQNVAANRVAYMTNFNDTIVHCWLKPKTGTANGYLFREIDESGVERRAVEIGNAGSVPIWQVRQATVFERVGEDGVTTYKTGSSTSGGGHLEYKYNYIYSNLGSIYSGRGYNNHMFGLREDPTSIGRDTSIFYMQNGTTVPSFDVRDDYGMFDADGNFRTDYQPSTLNVETTRGLKRDSSLTSTSIEQFLTLKETPSISLDFSNTSGILASFYYESSNELSVGDAYDLIYGIDGNHDPDYFQIRINTAAAGGNFPNPNLPPKVEMIIRIEEGTNQKSTIIDITDFYRKQCKYVIRDQDGISTPFVTVYNVEDKKQEVLVGTILNGNTSGAFWSTSTNITQFDIFDRNSENPNVGSSTTTDGVILSEVVLADINWVSTAAAVTAMLNKGATVDYASSYWTNLYTAPQAWWRLGNETGADEIDTADLINASVPSPVEVHDLSGNGNDLITRSPIGFLAAAQFGPPRQKDKPVGFHTSSIDQAYVFCATSSTNNAAGDFLTNVDAAEFAMFTIGGSTDPSEYAVSPTYCFIDLTGSSLTTKASIWYGFEDTDTIGSTSAAIANKNTTYSAYSLGATYSSETDTPLIRNDGLALASSADYEYQITQVAQSGAVAAVGAGITSITPSLISAAGSDFYIGGALGYNASGAAGVLMNSYNSFHLAEVTGTMEVDNYLSAACLYTRRHTLTTASSFQHPFVKSDFFTKNQISYPASDGVDDFFDYELYQGMALWEAAAQSGKKPFYDEYKDYAVDIRLLNKDYSVVPEFKISDHIDKFLSKGDTEFSAEDNPLLEITGGHNDKWNSDLDGFYETYSTTDFLKMFDLIQEEHDDFVNPVSLKLKCKGVKKFLPYKGFYPADRTVEISEQFYNSYNNHIQTSTGLSGDGNYAVQNLLTPLFSPGILFNTIKSGVACDYPIMTGLFATGSQFDGADPVSGTYTINEQFHKRIPFEALIEPEKYLSNQPLYPQEPDPLGNLDITVTWDGQGDEKYRLMMSNFLAETGEFFLKNKDYAAISSLPEGDPNFGNVEAGKTYMMRIKMYRTVSGQKELFVTDPSKDYAVPLPQGSFAVPQDNIGNTTSSYHQTFTMYSRPSSFGPPQRLYLSGAIDTAFYMKFTNWSDYKRSGSIDTFYKVDESVMTIVKDTPVFDAGFDDLALDSDNSHYVLGNDATRGYNYPFTPPYYHGEAWADITFTATNTEKLSLSQIINSSSIEFLRFYKPMEDHELTGGPNEFESWRLINEDAMQLASSVNLFSKGVLKKDITQTNRKGIRNDVQVQVDTNVSNQYRWIIQSKFETPILNFNKYNLSNGEVTVPGNARWTTPIGMWHQYGEIPQTPEEGVFLQVTDVPSDWIDNAMGAKSYETGSLADLCGFSTDPVRLGEVSPTKTIKEAVVAIPFIENQGEKQFFTIEREDIENALEPSTRNLVGKTIQEMTHRMKEYIFPPSMDFINNKDIDPFAMYIFEFKHVLTKKDLVDIWQNLPPDIGTYQEEAQAVISHELLSHELLGGKADLKPGRNAQFELNRQVRKDKIDSKIRWMIFKVKQRGKANYFEKIFARNESQEQGSQLDKATLSSIGSKKKVGYNWPYDYFSLVELIKIDAEVDFARPDDENQEERFVIKPYVKAVSNSTNQNLINNALFGTTLSEPEQPQGVIQERIPKGKKRK